MDICLLTNSIIVLVTKIAEKVTCQEKPKEKETEDFMVSKQWVGDYLDLSLPETRVPMVAIERMNERINTGCKIEERTLRKVTNTCKRLIELFAMERGRKEQINKIKEIVARHDKDMADEIDLSRFSTCQWYEGRIALFR
jgi:predicted DNA-binding protein (UPF0278 family)